MDGLISDNSLSPEIVGDIINLGSLSSNWNSRNIKDYLKNSSDARLVIRNLNINSISNKFDNFK